MKKPTLGCFTWIVFIELNFIVAFLLIRKTWGDQFAIKVGGGMGEFEKWGWDLGNGGTILKWEADNPLRTIS